MAASAGVKSQVCFTGEASCAAFAPHFLKPDLCRECNRAMGKHAATAVQDCFVVAAIEAKGGTPSLVLPADGEGQAHRHAVYHAGVKAALKTRFHKDNQVRLIVNTAKDLDQFFPKYAKFRAEFNAGDGRLVEVPWTDSLDQVLDETVLRETISLIHAAREQGAVFIHCAQGKSRSSTLVLAYMLAADPSLDVDTGLAHLQARRKMAEPNKNFLGQLRALAARGFFGTVL